MKKFILLILLLTTVTLISNSQTLESFEGAFPPTGWTATGFTQTSNKAYMGSYSATGNVVGNELRINNVTPSNTSLTFFFTHSNNGGPNNATLTTYIWNASINGGAEQTLGAVIALSLIHI